MNAYTSRSRATIRHHDIAVVLRTDVYLAAASLEALERQRGGQAEAEMVRLLTQHGLKPHPAASLVLQLRQTIGAALVHAGQHLAGDPQSGISRETAPAEGTLGIAG